MASRSERLLGVPQERSKQRILYSNSSHQNTSLSVLTHPLPYRFSVAEHQILMFCDFVEVIHDAQTLKCEHHESRQQNRRTSKFDVLRH